MGLRTVRYPGRYSDRYSRALAHGTDLAENTKTAEGSGELNLLSHAGHPSKAHAELGRGIGRLRLLRSNRWSGCALPLLVG